MENKGKHSMRLLITWLLGVPAAIVLLFNVFAVDPAVVFAPSSAILVSSVTSVTQRQPTHRCPPAELAYVPQRRQRNSDSIDLFTQPLRSNRAGNTAN
jgi:hypothetical protein